jgi:hypothetical protein
MPGDAKQCRQRALNCMLEAKAARTPQARENFANLARSWIKLAEEFELTQALLAEVELKEPEEGAVATSWVKEAPEGRG